MRLNQKSKVSVIAVLVVILLLIALAIQRFEGVSTTTVSSKATSTGRTSSSSTATTLSSLLTTSSSFTTSSQTTSSSSSSSSLTNTSTNEAVALNMSSFFASAQVKLQSSNNTYAQYIFTFPDNSSFNLTIVLTPNQTYTPTSEEANQTVYDINATYSNSSANEIYELQFFVPNGISELTNTSASPAVAGGNSAFQVPGVSKQLVPTFDIIQIGQEAEVPGTEVTETVSDNLIGQAAVALKEAYDDVKYIEKIAAWLQELAELIDCAQNPTNPLTIQTYQQNPAAQQQLVDQLRQIEAEVIGDTSIASLGKGLGSYLGEASENPALAFALSQIIDQALEGGLEAVEELVSKAKGMVVDCSCGQGTPVSQAPPPPPEINNESGGFSPSPPEPPVQVCVPISDLSGSFLYSFNPPCTPSNTQTCFDQQAYGAFVFSVNGDTGLINGTGEGIIVSTDTGQCISGGSDHYSFLVNGGVAGYNSTSWGFSVSNVSAMGGFNYTDACTNYPPCTPQYYTPPPPPVVPPIYTPPQDGGCGVYTGNESVTFPAVYPMQWTIVGRIAEGNVGPLVPYQYYIDIGFVCTPSIPICASYK